LPEANVESRTLRVRVELPNADGRLRPGMFARVHLEVGDAQPALFVPSEALIRTGVRTLLIVAAADGRFEPTEVRIGVESNGKTAILSGVREGQRVVASGQFLIDSEASLRGVLARLGGEKADTSAAPGAMPPTPAAKTLHEATGKIKSFAPGEIVISHGPIESLGLEPMTMPFKLDRPELTQGLKVGETVDFRFRVQDGEFVIEQVRKAGGGP
jgi:Cu(I)/Ag(I) efflux system membrane fusion protein